MVEIFIAFKASRTNSQKSNPVAMLRIEVGVDLKNKSAEPVFIHPYHPFAGFPGAGHGGNADKGVEHFLYSEIINGRSKENRRHIAGEITVHCQFTINPVNEFHILAKGSRVAVAQFV